MKWYENYDFFLKKFEEKGGMMDETKFYFRSESKGTIHYIGCKNNLISHFGLGIVTYLMGVIFFTAKEMFEGRYF